MIFRFHSTPLLMAFSELIGKPIAIRESSLGCLGSFRAKIWCRNLACIRGFVEIFPAASAHRIRVRVEGHVDNQAPPPSSIPLLPCHLRTVTNTTTTASRTRTICLTPLLNGMLTAHTCSRCFLHMPLVGVLPRWPLSMLRRLLPSRLPRGPGDCEH